MQKIPFLTLVKSIVSLRCCSIIIYCCLTNHPKIQLLKTTTILLVMILQLRNLSGWLITSVDSVCWAYSCGHIPLMAGRAGSSEAASFTCLRPLCWLSAGMLCFSVSSLATWSLILRAFLSTWPSLQQDSLDFFTWCLVSKRVEAVESPGAQAQNWYCRHFCRFH